MTKHHAVQAVAPPWLILSRLLLCVSLLCASATVNLHADEPRSGQELYKQHCAVCHSAGGEGTEKHFPEPLTGDRPVGDLAKFIAESMPPETPEACGGDDAQRVAEFIFGEFYSPAAYARKHAPHIDTARLTEKQYGLAVADLMVAFFGPRQYQAERGLKGSYAAIDENGNGKQVFDRIDPQIQFDFGKSSPKPDEIDPAEFAISWSGSLLAPADGDYEFIVRSPNSIALYVNDRNTPLIDAWVKSGDQNEFRATRKLIAGRYHLLRLNFTKAGQGAKKTEQLRAKIAPAVIALAWKRPGQEEELIPARYLSPHEVRETMVVQANFPPDDRSTGFERGTSVSAEWDQATTRAAIEAATYVRGRLGDFCGVTEPNQEHEPALREFCAKFAALAFRRPLTGELRALYVDRQFQRAPDPGTAVERTVLMVLKSPRFLYVDLPGAPVDDFSHASRLSFILWDSLPDDALLAAAAAGELNSREQLAAHAQRMMADPRFTAKLHAFFLQWLKIDELQELRKDAADFPEFSAAVASDLRTSLELFLDEVLTDERADFRSLLLADYVYLNQRLAPLYGAEAPGDGSFHKMTPGGNARGGLLSHPYLMAAFAGPKASSPIRRGVFLARSVLGRTLRPPPDAVTPDAPSLHPGLTTRERTIKQTEAQTCQTCHGLINPLGFALERFDAIGRLRDSENDKPIDAGGTYQSLDGSQARFNGARELAAFLAASPEVHEALIEKLFYYSVKQPIRAYGSDMLPSLRRSFVNNEFNLRHLMAEMAIAAALANVSPDGSSVTQN